MNRLRTIGRAAALTLLLLAAPALTVAQTPAAEQEVRAVIADVNYAPAKKP